MPFPINNTHHLSEPGFLVLSLNYFKMLYIYIYMLNLFITWPDLVFIVYNSKFSTITVFAGGSESEQVKNLPAMQEPQGRSLG